MLADELAQSIPGYRIERTAHEGGDTVVLLVNEVNGKRFVISAKRIEQLAGGTSSLGNRIHEELTQLAAGMPVRGIRRLENGLLGGK